jgi:threonyl-tRNA synthetase
MDLYSTHPEAGSGLIYWHPKGARIRHYIESFWKDEHYRNGYELIYTPHVGKGWLWETSGHLGFYNENMYSPIDIDGEEYYIKPMNCPFHIMIYKSRTRSYRDLPLRWAELGTVYRYERSGVLHGLLRVRGFTQDDAHIICTPEQVEDEIREVLRFSLHMWKEFGFSTLKAYLSTRPEKSVGEEERWIQATNSLKNAILAEGLEYEVDEGGGAFYGPKIDIKIKDALGREWQMSTIQFDFNLPERFDMVYTGSDGNKHRPYMIHRALLGSIERFFGVLTEHYAGAFPVWLMPTQMMIIPVAMECNEYGMKIQELMRENGIRCEGNFEHLPLNQKIKLAQQEKIPYMVIVGKNEVENGTLSLRLRGNKKMNDLSVDEVLNMIKMDIKEKR